MEHQREKSKTIPYSQLPPGAFAAFESRDLLLKLSLAGNRLTDAALTDAAVFRPLRSLQELSLETNSLSQIPSAALVNQRETLTNLNLGLNNINEVRSLEKFPEFISPL